MYEDISKVSSVLHDIQVLHRYMDLVRGLGNDPVLGGYAKQVYDALPFGHVGNLTTSERYINAEKGFKQKSKH